MKYFVPNNLDEALKILDENDCYIMCGGTDLMVQKHSSSGLLPNFDRDVIFVSNLKELDFIKEENNEIHVGATTKYSSMEQSSLVPEIYKRVIKEIASPNIRNMASMTGNICNASPAGDSVVPLVIDDARVVILSKNNKREMLVDEFIQGYRKTAHKKEEIVSEIIIPKQDLTYFYRKVGSRKAETITKVSFLGAYKIEKGIIKDLRIAFGSVFVKTVRNKDIERKYIGKKVTEINSQELVSDYSPLVQPITDQRSTKEYRHVVALNLLKEFIKQMKGGCNE